MEYRDDPSIAVETLMESTSRRANKEERLLVDFLLRGVKCQRFSGADAINGLHYAACGWGDVALWLRSAAVCGANKRVDLIGVDEIIAATLRFGFAHIHTL